jgi:hypothetical protein
VLKYYVLSVNNNDFFEDLFSIIESQKHKTRFFNLVYVTCHLQIDLVSHPMHFLFNFVIMMIKFENKISYKNIPLIHFIEIKKYTFLKITQLVATKYAFERVGVRTSDSLLHTFSV